MSQVNIINFTSSKQSQIRWLYTYYYTTRSSEIESLNNEIKRIIIDEEQYTEVDYPFLINQIFQH